MPGFQITDPQDPWSLVCKNDVVVRTPKMRLAIKVEGKTHYIYCQVLGQSMVTLPSLLWKTPCGEEPYFIRIASGMEDAIEAIRSAFVATGGNLILEVNPEANLAFVGFVRRARRMMLLSVGDLQILISRLKRVAPQLLNQRKHRNCHEEVVELILVGEGLQMSIPEDKCPKEFSSARKLAFHPNSPLRTDAWTLAARSLVAR